MAEKPLVNLQDPFGPQLANDFQGFYAGTLDAISKVCPVLTDSPVEKNCCDYMFDKGWDLTLEAKEKWGFYVIGWFSKNYADLQKANDGLVSFDTLGVLFVCSMTGQGTGLWDLTLVGKELAGLGNKLHASVKAAYPNSELILYRKSGKWCIFNSEL